MIKFQIDLSVFSRSVSVEKRILAKVLLLGNGSDGTQTSADERGKFENEERFPPKEKIGVSLRSSASY
jgi:hypothetical protein